MRKSEAIKMVLNCSWLSEYRQGELVDSIVCGKIHPNEVNHILNHYKH